MDLVTRAAALLLVGLLAACSGDTSVAPGASVESETVNPDAGINDAYGSEMP
jgi:hypothetical protein